MKAKVTDKLRSGVRGVDSHRRAGLALGEATLDMAGSGSLAGGRRLSAGGALKSVWTVPDWLNPVKGGCGMTYHFLPRWAEDGTLRSAARRRSATM